MSEWMRLEHLKCGEGYYFTQQEVSELGAWNWMYCHSCKDWVHRKDCRIVPYVPKEEELSKGMMNEVHKDRKGIEEIDGNEEKLDLPF